MKNVVVMRSNTKKLTHYVKVFYIIGIFISSKSSQYRHILPLSIIIIAINNLGIALINVIASCKVVHSVDWVCVGVLDLYCSPLSLLPSAYDRNNDKHNKNKENQGTCDHCK